MFLAPVLAIIIIRFFRKSLRTDEAPTRWRRIFLGGMIAAVIIIMAEASYLEGRIVFGVLGYALLLSLTWLGLAHPLFRHARTVIYAALPLIILSIVNEVVKIFFPWIDKKWEMALAAINIFAIIWMVVMMIIYDRQRKALEKARIKALEIEKENQITAKIKAGLEIQVEERTAALTKQKEELQQTLNELKSTQAQLIQSEKMASLGELTAGIAHEIQNPLNFVNNFSEVSTELIKEMIDEIGKGNVDEVKSIGQDLVQNLEKISHHGKRADAIVKGMLQHSRSNTGQKEMTDINVLADEYLRLSYHGLRAKDKSFNANFKTDLDNSIGKINVISQDIGRVILNLINNAFYAVSEKQKQAIPGYEPTVIVSTKKLPGKVEIRVTDNGNGIPSKILDKIFQPFFTTKPAGAGTGLGLSLSYDIITKAHNGQLKVETKDREGTTFIITLPG